ncbi:MAG: hypothetical protein IPI06_15500 [Gammaproteobacteria bacterium]|nr:hypothetical protein [Gammaproteobacteria bacterium]
MFHSPSARRPRDVRRGASRRPRHAGKVPAILYGGQSAPRSLVLDQQSS